MIYNYDSETGEYLSKQKARKSPLEDDVYLIPANATDIKPKKSQSNRVNIFSDGKWLVKLDYRGSIYYLKEDGSEFKVTDVGWELTDRYTEKPMPEYASWVDNGWLVDMSLVEDADALDQIRELEKKVTPRRLREAILTASGKAWIENIDRDIKGARTKLRKVVD